MPGTAVFVFPSAAGHVNPSLPLCQRLVSLGWKVEYLGIDTFKDAIEKTGATFHDRNAVCAAHGIDDFMSMAMKTLEDYGDPGAKVWGLNFGSILTQKLLPVYISWLRSISPQVVVYCPVLCQVAHFSAMHLQIPSVSLLTAAGPGYLDAAFAAHGSSAAGLVATIKANEPNSKAIEGIRSLLGMPNLTLNTAEPVVNEYYSKVNIVSTVPSLADKLEEKNVQFYNSIGKAFEFVGPLLGENQVSMASALSEQEQADLFKRVEDAVTANRKIVYVSMGTVVTGDSAEHGWNGTSGSAITGKQLCHSVYRAVFGELGCSVNNPVLSPPPLIIVSLGPQPDAITDISVPDNALCLRTAPQVALLRAAKPALFVSNGGQNSFIEAMSVGTPLVICPGFGDQITNAAKVHNIGLGLKVDRPALADASGKDVAEVVAMYQTTISERIREALGASNSALAAKAQAVATELERGGGVHKAVELVLKVAGVIE